jgi:cysteinyl-tRNA synthetase
MTVRLYNTLSRRKEDLRPLRPGKVGLYTCGPTVYNFQHVGNYRTYIFEDILVRTLEHLGYEVQREINITDVGHLTSQADEGEDKMEVGAAREGKSAWDLAKFYTDAFVADCKELHVRLPAQLRRATEHIPEQIALIERLQAKGFVYKTSDGLYFDASKFPSYDALAGKEHIAGIQAGARVEANPEKKNPTDFALWKFSPKDKHRQMEWDSPWGRGFPGWHIECSAMAMKYLGPSFDIHCGGVDHIPIHHSNEIAQSEAATGRPFVKIWMHGEFLLMNNAKMAKSEGGFVTVKALKDRGFDPLDYRYHCLTAHYRKQLDFTWESLEAARTARRRLKTFAESLNGSDAPACAEHVKAFEEALSDDLNVPKALGVVHDCIASDVPAGAKKKLLQLAESIFAIGIFDKEEALAPELQALIDQRAEAKKNKDFKAADELRAKLAAAGIVVEDSKGGQKWRRK